MTVWSTGRVRRGQGGLLIGSVTALALICGCSSPTASEDPSAPASASAEPSGPESSTPSPGDPQGEWRSAVDTTASAESVLLEAQLITDVEGFERITSGTGYVELQSGHGDIEWTDELGDSRELITQDGHFLELDDTWFQIERAGSLPTTVAFDPLAGLESATNIVAAGSEEVLGAQTYRFDADLDPSMGMDVMGFSEEERTVFPTEASSTHEQGSLIATIWVDQEGRIVRVLREFQTMSADGDPISATSLLLLRGWGTTQPLETPADAIPAPV